MLELSGLMEQVVVLEEGEVVARGLPHEVFDAPRRETVASLAGFENIFEAEVLGHNRRMIDVFHNCGFETTDRRFDEWSQDALRYWPELSDAVLQTVSG